MNICPKILKVFFLTVFVLIGGRKQGAQTSPSYNIKLIEGYHVWTGKKFFLALIVVSTFLLIPQM